MADELDIESPPTTKAVEAVFRPLSLSLDEPVLIYHYCSGDTLLAILRNKTLRFGEASQMNDGEEIVWAERQFETAIKRLHDRDDIPSDVPVVVRGFLDKLQSSYASCSKETRQFLVSFSRSADSLSQWRAYADDARGFSIGFDSTCIDVPARMLKVEYDPEKQQDYIIRAIAAMSEASKKPRYKDANFESDIQALYHYMACFKNPAFIDEREVRASHLILLWKEEDGRWALSFCGGTVGDQNVDDREVEFRAKNGAIVPYIDFPFQVHSACGVRDIWLGPCCPNTPIDIEILLGTLGYKDVKVSVAGAKYRK